MADIVECKLLVCLISATGHERGRGTEIETGIERGTGTGTEIETNSKNAGDQDPGKHIHCTYILHVHDAIQLVLECEWKLLPPLLLVYSPG